jgi:hypothetical protein
LSFGLFGDCDLPEIEAHLYVTPSANASVKFEGAAFNSYEKDYELANVVLAPAVVSVGPLVFTVNIDVIARIEGTASSGFAVGAKASVQATTGLEWGSFSGLSFKPPVPQFSFAPDGTDVTLSGRASVRVGPRLSFRLYGVAGPYAGLYAQAGVDADQARTPCWELHAGAAGDVGFILTLLGLGNLINVRQPFSIIDETIASGSCKQPPGASKKPPGGGPDAEHLLNPTFTPWAKMYDSPIKWFPHQSRDLAWLDVTRAIDGRLMVAGWGLDALSKVDLQGGVLWSKRYLDPRTDSPWGPEPAPYLLQRVVPTADASMFVVAHPYALLKLGQAGGVEWAQRYEFPGKVLETGPNGWQMDQRTFLSAVSDGAGGLYLAGTFQASDAVAASMWLMRVNPDGSPRWSRKFDAGSYLYPTSMVAVEDGVVIAGLDWDKPTLGRRLLLAGIRADGTVGWAKRTPGCDGLGYPGIQPFDAQRLSGGGVLVSGVIDNGRRSFVLQLKPDGTVQWASAPWGDDALTDMVIHAVRELPTTGFLAVGRYAYHYDPSRLFVAGLDVAGQTQWLKAYGQPSTQDWIEASQSFPTMHLTDEGGAWLTAHTTAPTPSQDKNLWALHVPARDGAMVFQPGAAELFEFPHATAACTLLFENVALAAAPLEAVPDTFTPIVEPAALQVSSQAP